MLPDAARSHEEAVVMPEITALTPSKRHKGRLHIYIDGRFMASVDAMTIALHGLKVGQRLGDAALNTLEREAVHTRLVDRCLHFLSYRQRSEAELRNYLRRQEATPEQGDAVLADLRRQNLVDDEAFAKFWRESRDRFAPRGEGMLQAELRAKGVAAEVVAGVLPDAEEEEILARRAGERHLRQLRAAPWPEFRTRMLSYLQRRGFRYEVANRTTRELWAAERREAAADADDDGDAC
jgi:regulatory protein